MKKIIITFIIISSTLLINAQTKVNREWIGHSGNPVFNPLLSPFGYQWSKSITAANGDLLTVGHTFVTGQGENILLTRYNRLGVLLWTAQYNTSGAQNDYGTDVYEDASGKIVACGTTDNGGSTNYDAILLQYSSAGVFQSVISYNGPNGKNDIATSVRTETATGNIFLAATRESTVSSYDYFVIKYKPNGTILWSNSYNYANLIDVPTGMQILPGKVVVPGASASAANKWDYTTVVFNPTTGSILSTTRDSLSGYGYDQPLAYKEDAAGNLYMTGRASTNGINYNIRTIKISPTNTIVWSQTYDAYGLEDNGNTIAVDASGNVIVGGFVTKSNNVKDLIILKYSPTGTLLWKQTQTSKDPSADAFVKTIALNSAGDIYFIGGEKGIGANKQAIVGKLKASGSINWERSILGSYNYLPSDIQYNPSGATPGLYTIAIKDSTTKVYETAYYTELDLDTAKATYGASTYKKSELIVRFLSTALQKPVINNTVGTAITEFTDLQTVLTATAYTQVSNAIFPYCRDCKIKAVKIFPDMLTTDTLAHSKLNELISKPDFWTALNLVLPSGFSVKDAYTVFNKIPAVAQYAHPNFLAILHGSNDSLYNKQYSLHTNTVYTNADVNLEEAYKVIPSGGQPGIRCAVIDQNVDWQHKDYGYDGVNTASSKIVGGLWWGPNLPMKSQAHGQCGGDFHGSAVMGIIGATRNNTVGIAGIAGGNDSIGSKGISLYSEGVFLNAGYNIAPMTQLTEVITYAAQSPADVGFVSPINKLYGCNSAHILNCSIGFYAPPLDTGWYATVNQNNTIVSEAVHFVNRLKTTVVASRGNGNAGANYATLSSRVYPANCDDDWVICVSGTGTDGQFIHNSAPFTGVNGEFTGSFGGDIDVAAPATYSLVKTLGPGAFNDLSPSITNNYISFQGTSASAPHVSGAVGLIMSYLYDSTKAYATFPTPEDCEHIIQMSATDTDIPGPTPDSLTGYGRLNIGKAMRMIEKPMRKLRHFNTKAPFSYSVTKTLVSAVDTIRTTEQWKRKNPNGSYTPFPKGKYIVKTYQINSTVFHNILPADTIVDYWERPSSSVTFPAITGTGQNKKLMPREKTKIMGINNSNCALRGYIYQVKDSTGANVGWWPVDTAFINTTTYNYGEWAEYTVLTKNATTNGVKEHSDLDNNISLYPNPANSSVTLEVKTKKVCQLTVDLYDMMGRKLKTLFNGKSDFEKTIITTDVANLPNSLYFYYITVDGVKTLKKFVKQ
ncbi:MAG: S8 family serine peptidase [Bacteroidetes bacterium]|nr:S8 family serine peptidase [Bacteroidota bacterium]